MKNKTEEYLPFDKYILRTPTLSTKIIDSIISSSDIRKIFNNTFIKEAIYLASPELFQEINKYLNGELSETGKIELSILKYLTRMSNRCTPFGLFASCELGKTGDTNTIELNEVQDYKRITRLDMNYLSLLVQIFEKDSSVRENLLYYPNTSLYKIGDKLRYVEYFMEKSVRKHFTISIDFSEYLERIIDAAKNGSGINELANLIKEGDITLEDALEFVHELIDNQILVSSISPTVSGQDNFDQIIQGISKAQNTQWADKVNRQIKKMDDLSNQNTNFLDIHSETAEILTSFDKNYNKKYLFQTDLISTTKKNEISSSILKQLQDGVRVLNLLSRKFEHQRLKNFKEAFYKRFEEEEIPIMLALDVEAGIGYGTENVDFYDSSPLIDDLIFYDDFDLDVNDKEEYTWTGIDKVLYSKLIYVLRNDLKELRIADEDLQNLKEDWEDLPTTFSMLCSVLSVKNDQEPLIYIDYTGGNSASSLLGRFCHTDKNIFSFVKEIVKKEEANDILNAEIVHLPEARTGNILYRPNLREYEIPYLSASTLENHKQLKLDDIYVSIKNDEIIIRSKKHNKKIQPKLSNAHAFGIGSLPIYLFLCDLQSQGLRSGLSFSWGELMSKQTFLPRVTYKNLILSLAQWTLSKDEIGKLKNVDSVRKLTKLKNIPNKFLLSEGDNELFIDLTNELSANMFISSIKNKQNILIKEYLFDNDNPLVKRNNESFTNEIIFSFYKKN
ncbi:lantibiotic dehydratase family protein [Aquimarina algiphila]|uniref:lantibiotic dehydratase family protein n=1 Tax=Aquimarina algiphila TaxID=2047982 RepID=UPI0024921F9E|nr:lantibiotic dehydratase family protein [Aquimarina algiphila]